MESAFPKDPGVTRTKNTVPTTAAEGGSASPIEDSAWRKTMADGRRDFCLEVRFRLLSFALWNKV